MPMALISSSGIGSYRATFFAQPSLFLNRVFELSGISANDVPSLTICIMTLAAPVKALMLFYAPSFELFGSSSMFSECDAPLPTKPSALTIKSVNGLSSVSVVEYSAPVGARRRTTNALTFMAWSPV